MTLDPGNTSAHRFLSDTYIGVPRREIARVSELLQAQMLQDININPVQPSLAETNLSLVTRGGPFKPGFNEYTPLFERNDVQFQASGLAGNEDTHGFEGIASALYDRFSISAGAFSYETDGWRPNDGIQHNIEDFFMQAAVTPDLNMQVELRRRESQQGDLAFNFDPDFFNPDQHSLSRSGYGPIWRALFTHPELQFAGVVHLQRQRLNASLTLPLTSSPILTSRPRRRPIRLNPSTS